MWGGGNKGWELLFRKKLSIVKNNLMAAQNFCSFKCVLSLVFKCTNYVVTAQVLNVLQEMLSLTWKCPLSLKFTAASTQHAYLCREASNCLHSFIKGFMKSYETMIKYRQHKQYGAFQSGALSAAGLLLWGAGNHRVSDWERTGHAVNPKRSIHWPQRRTAALHTQAQTSKHRHKCTELACNC